MRPLLVLALGISLSATALADVHYTLTPEPANGSVRVTIAVDDPGRSEAFRIPAWCPGFYFLQDYQKKISDFKATDQSGNPLQILRGEDPRQWIVQNPGRTSFTVSYRVLGDDAGLGFFGTNVLKHRAFVNGPSAFLYSPERLRQKTTLEIKNPPSWEVATGMNSDEAGRWVAADYDELIDHPLQLGKFEKRSFIQGGVPFEVIFVSPDQQYRPDLDAETERLKLLSLPAIRLFGSAPFKRYVYMIHLGVGNFAGGLEHRSSTVIALPNGRPMNMDDLAAHEFFHAWNVKQIRPKVLGPFDYTQPVRTANLWFAEGVTDYYAQITTYRSGLHDSDWLIRQLQAQVRELQASQERKKTTLADTSKRAWESGGFGVKDLSYYNKGLLVGWILDAAIRDATGGEKSLDDVMRLLYKRHALPKPGYEEDGILKVVNEVAEADLTALYDRMVNSTEELPYEILEKIGIKVDAHNGQVKFDVAANSQAADLRTRWLERPRGIR